MIETGKPCSFDENIDRRLVPALKVHPRVLGSGGEDLFAAGVADMDIKAPPAVLEALQRRLDHGVFGYETLPDGLMPALIQWRDRRHGWQLDESHVLRENRREPIANPLILKDGRYRMDFDGLEAKAATPRTKMIYLCNPHNPVGRIWSAGELRRLGDICARHGVLVMADEIHGDITFSGHAYTPFAALGPDYAKNCIVCTRARLRAGLGRLSRALATVF